MPGAIPNILWNISFSPQNIPEGRLTYLLLLNTDSEVWDILCSLPKHTKLQNCNSGAYILAQVCLIPNLEYIIGLTTGEIANIKAYGWS